MKIKSLHLANVKGCSVVENLDAATIYMGANASGKTARLNGIMLALTGRVPGLPGTNAGLFSLSSGSSMTAAVEWETGGKWTREWAKKGKTVSLKATPKDAAMPGMFLDAAVYFDAGPKARRDMIVDCLGSRLEEAVPDITWQKFREDWLKGIQTHDAVTPDNAALVADLVAKVQPRIEFDVKPHNFVEEIESRLELVAKAITETKAAHQRHQGAAQSISELRAAATTSGRVNDELKALREELATARGDLREVDLAIHAFEEAETIISGGMSDVIDVAAKLAEIGCESVEDFRLKFAEHKAKLAALETSAEHLSEKVRTAGDLRLKLAESKRRLETAGSEPEVMSEEDFRAYSAKVGRCLELLEKRDKLREEERAKAEENREHARLLKTANAECDERDAEAAEVDGLETCPYCGCDGEGWRDAVELKASEALRKAHEKRREAQERLDSSNAALIELRDRLTGIGAEIMDLPSTHDVPEKQYRARDEWKAKVDPIKAQIADFESRLAEIGEDIEERYERVLEQGETLAELVEVWEPLGEVLDEERAAKVRGAQAAENVLREKHGSKDALSIRFAGTQDTIAKLDKQIAEKEMEAKKLTQARAEYAAAQRAVEERDKAAVELVVWEWAKLLFEERRAEFVCGVFDLLVERANALCGDLLRSSGGSELRHMAGDLGMMRGKHWVPLTTFSGSEQALTYAAVSIALASLGDGFKLCLLDEMGRLDSERCRQLGWRVKVLLEKGVIDQFVGALAVSKLPEHGCAVPGFEWASLREIGGAK